MEAGLVPDRTEKQESRLEIPGLGHSHPSRDTRGSPQGKAEPLWGLWSILKCC